MMEWAIRHAKVSELLGDTCLMQYLEEKGRPILTVVVEALSYPALYQAYPQASQYR